MQNSFLMEIAVSAVALSLVLAAVPVAAQQERALSDSANAHPAAFEVAPAGKGIAPRSDAVADQPILTPRTSAEISYLSGGVGQSERDELERVKGDYSLHLMFAESSGSYLSDLPVTIRNDAGKTVLEVTSEGPWFYVQLQPGQYKVAVSNAGDVQTVTLSVPENGIATKNFYWK